MAFVAFIDYSIRSHVNPQLIGVQRELGVLSVLENFTEPTGDGLAAGPQVTVNTESTSRTRAGV